MHHSLHSLKTNTPFSRTRQPALHHPTPNRPLPCTTTPAQPPTALPHQASPTARRNPTTAPRPPRPRMQTTTAHRQTHTHKARDLTAPRRANMGSRNKACTTSKVDLRRAGTTRIGEVEGRAEAYSRVCWLLWRAVAAWTACSKPLQVAGMRAERWGRCADAARSRSVRGDVRLDLF